MLQLSSLDLLKNRKNLLAFSAGIDSSALFFLLVDNNIPFDIALVNYGTRENSGREEQHAHNLAKQYDLTCHSMHAPKYESHFEQNARNFRYDFFEKLIEEYGYNNLLTPHQLKEKMEWLLMRLTKGAGVSELIGLEAVSERKNYTLLRPLLTYSKEELLKYLKENDHPYFIDESNSDERYERNQFRKAFSDPLIAEFKEGIQRSFDYLKNDKDMLEEKFETYYSDKKLRIIKINAQQIKSKAADLTLNSLGYLLSASQRQEIAKENSLVIGGEWAIEMQDDLLYIAPYVTIDMPKKFKEQCRILKIPVKIRAYCFTEKINIQNLPT
jgi:tRNA(Ile)-lysidine synthase